MSKLTKSKGNMYKWCTHTHSHLKGECPHKCKYCYVQAMAKRFPNMKKKYSGELRLDEKALEADYGKGRVIFIEHMNDLFAEGVADWVICTVLGHCARFPDNQYVFQTKNPERYAIVWDYLPENAILGTTIESDLRHEVMGDAPDVNSRLVGITEAKKQGFETFITIEPILKFSPVFAGKIGYCMPSFVNIGADSKGHGLTEPTFPEIMELYQEPIDHNIEVRKKINLERLEKANG